MPAIGIIIGCSTPLLLLSIFIAFRLKSFQTGLYVFLLLAGFLVLVTISADFIVSLPESILKGLSLIVSIISVGFICISAMLHWLNSKRAGKIYGNLQPDKRKLFLEYVWGILFLAFAVSKIETDGDTNDHILVISNMLAASVIFGRIFLSFQLREKGFVDKGRLIRFEGIQSMTWEHLLRKDKVKVITHEGKTMTIKIPWELLTPVDNHIRNHFSRK